MIIKKITGLFFVLFLSFVSIAFTNQAEASYFTNSVEAEGADCGVAGQGSLVAPKSFSICKEDLAYNILYMSFSKIFNNFSILKSFVFEGAGDLDLSGYANDMGGAILAVILGLTQIVFIVGSLILGVVTIKVLFKSMTSGEFLGKGVSKVWLILRTLGVIFLIFPLDSTVSLAQLFIIMVALLSIMGGNFFYGLFLSIQQEQSLVAEDNFLENQEKALGQAEALVNMSLCQSRTIKSIRNKNFKDYDDGFVTDLNFTEQLSRVSNCMAPEVYFTYPSASIGGTGSKYGRVESVKFTKKDVCEGTAGTVLFSEYDPKYHGFPFSCGVINFSHPSIGNEVNSAAGKSDANAIFSSTSQKAIDKYVAAGLSAFNTTEKLAAMEIITKTIKSGSPFSWNSLDSNINATAATLTPLGKALYTSVKADTDHNTAVKTLFVANSLLLNNLLGSRSPAAESIVTGTDVAVALIVPGGGTVLAAKEISKALQDKYSAAPTDVITLLEKYSVNSSSSIDEAHCLNNFAKVFDATKKTVKDLSTFSQTDFEDYKGAGDFFGECLWFVSANENNARYKESSTRSVGDSKLKLTFGSADVSKLLLKDNNQENRNAYKGLKDKEFPRLLLSAQADKMTLASYFYVARGAVKKTMLDVLDESTDKDLPKKMRKMGFASFGGFILQMSADQTNANRYIKQMNAGVSWSSFTEDGGSGYYINQDVYGNADESVIQGERNKFEPMSLGNFFSAGSNTNTIVASAATSGSSSIGDDDTLFLKYVLLPLERGLNGPLIYLKKMGGTDTSLTLREGVAKCFKESNCYPGEIHPVNALAYMGVDLIDTSVNFFLLHAVLALLKSALDMQGSGTTKGGWKGLLTTALDWFPVSRIVKGGVNIAYAVTTVLSPIFSALFLMGIFFGYMLPIMPYAAFFIMFLGWLIFIFQLLFTIPIWLIMIAIPAPNGQPRGNVSLLWQYSLLLLLKPSLMVIGLIIAWFFSIVSIFFINMTLFGVLGPVFEASTGEYIMKFIDIVMFYFIYLVVVFVALKHSFSIISSFPDSAAKALELRGYDDKSTISNVGAEQLLGLMIVNRVKDSVTSAFDTAIKQYKNDPNMHKEAALKEARNAATQRVDTNFSQMTADERASKNFNDQDDESLLDTAINAIKDPLGKNEDKGKV